MLNPFAGSIKIVIERSSQNFYYIRPMKIEIPDKLIERLKNECEQYDVPHSKKDLEEMISSQVQELIENFYKTVC